MRRSIDSLEQLLKKSIPDTARGRVLCFLSQAYAGLDSAKTFEYANQALSIQQKAQHDHGIALAYYSVANAHLEYGSPSSAKDYFEEALHIVRHDTTAEGTRLRIRVIGNLAYTEGLMGAPQKELNLLLTLVPDIERTNDTQAMAVVQHNIGSKFLNMQEFEKAYPYLVKASEILKKTRFTESLGFNYLNLALCMHELDSIPRMKYYLDLARSCFEKTPDSNEWSHYYTYYGQYLTDINQYQAALEAYHEARQIAERQQQWYRMENILLSIYEVYQQLKDYPHSRQALQEYYQNARKLNNKDNQLTALKYFATLEENANNFDKAYEYLKQYNQLKDSTQQNEIDFRIRELETKYQTSEKEKKILTLENTTQQQELDLQQSRFITYLLLAGVAILLLLLGLGFVIFRNSRRLIKQKEELHQQKFKELEQEKKLVTYSSMLQGQEQERKRIARDLHDGLGGMLAGVKMRLTNLAEKQQPPTSGLSLHDVINQLDTSVYELRRIARNMMPETLLKFGLEIALKDLCESIQNEQTKVVFQSYDLSKTIAQSDQIMIYRIIQELIANAIKYADAKQVLVQCIQENNTLHITIEDNGKGFDTSQKSGRGMGLANVQNRVDYLKGNIDIQSEPKLGTTIQIEVHVQEL